MDFLSERAQLVDASIIRKMWGMAQNMTDPVNFTIGQPDFDAPAPMKQAAIDAIQQGCNGYTLTAGIGPLREALAGRATEEFGWERPHVLITAGLSGGLLLAIMATLNPGDEVLIPDPYFVSYKHLTNLVGGRCVFVDTYPDFQLKADALAEAITDKTKLLLLNSPANPTGAVLDPAQRQAIAEVARRHNLLIVSDEIYWEFCYEGQPTSIAKYYENTLVLRGFSKTYGVPGWRLGYAIAPEPLGALFEQMATLQQYTFVCAPHPLQVAAVTALQTDMSEQIAAYRRKRDMVYEGLRDGYELIRPEGAFYAFIAAPGGEGTAFTEKAIEHNVLVIPGAAFSQRDSHFRLSYATTDERIQVGVERLRQLA